MAKSWCPPPTPPSLHPSNDFCAVINMFPNKNSSNLISHINLYLLSWWCIIFVPIPGWLSLYQFTAGVNSFASPRLVNMCYMLKVQERSLVLNHMSCSRKVLLSPNHLSLIVQKITDLTLNSLIIWVYYSSKLLLWLSIFIFLSKGKGAVLHNLMQYWKNKNKKNKLYLTLTIKLAIFRWIVLYE